ncbi:HdaA/DnaA family protein [Kordiimonas aquimaris]|uniref:HdaA/DnaA family protein n=1 Tax=Kordiimonas aquimaris TaxID=707591 RepID=UPI0021D07B69|nr:DnaA/Hda family protein [Kordiimonas aquimaris]
MATVNNQIPLDLKAPVSFDMADFIVSDSNNEAVEFISRWQGWSHHFVALVGPRACGKSHLLHGWAADVGAEFIEPDVDIAAMKPAGFYVLDDVNQKDECGNLLYDDVALFHLYNWLSEIGATLLVTAEDAPTLWPRVLPDLKSRLGTVPVAAITEPDDNLLIMLLVKLFSDRQLEVNIDVIHYILKHIERSFSAVHKLVETVDKDALARRRKVTKALVRECLNYQ